MKQWQIKEDTLNETYLEEVEVGTGLGTSLYAAKDCEGLYHLLVRQFIAGGNLMNRETLFDNLITEGISLEELNKELNKYGVEALA